MSRAPDRRFLLSHPAHFIAFGFVSGLAPRAPGTFGSLTAWALDWVLALVLPPLVIAFVAIQVFFLGVWASGVTARDLGVEDHGTIVIDEIAAFLPLAAFAALGQELLSDTLVFQAVAFGLFRLFDVWKPFPIRQFDERLKGGFGVMFDDIVAAGYAYVVLIVLVVAQHKMSQGVL